MTPGLSPIAVERLRAGDERIAVTGAGGWLGLATLDLLRTALGEDFDRRVVAFGSTRRTLELRGFRTEQHPLADLIALPPAPTIVLHFAFLTKDRAAAMADDAYRSACTAIRTHVLGVLDAIGARAVFVASSGAAALGDDPDASREMRLYGALKREDERAFAGWAEARGTRAVIARIFNLAGPHINKPQSYALAGFIRDAQAGRPIVVRAPHAITRGYVAIRELLSLALVLLAEEAGVVRFETGGTALELADVAGRVAAIVGGTLTRAAITSPLADTYLGDDDAYARLLARYGIARVAFDDAIAETAASLARETTHA